MYNEKALDILEEYQPNIRTELKVPVCKGQTWVHKTQTGYKFIITRVKNSGLICGKCVAPWDLLEQFKSGIERTVREFDLKTMYELKG